MLNTVYRLTQPRKIEIAFNEIDIFSKDVIVKPTYLSICNADQRYFQGTRDAKVLAKKLGMPFYDLDWYIETRMRKKVPEIFAEKGEEGFRKIEHNMLHEVAEFENVVISCGGGTPCFYDNMDYMNSASDVVYLKATPEILYAHLQMGKGIRPLLVGKSKEELLSFITEQLKYREQFYMKANHIIDISLMDSEDMVNHAAENIIKITS